MPSSSHDQKVGWTAVILLVGMVAIVIGAMVWLADPPSWSSSLEEVLWVVLLVAFGPALGRWAGASLRRTFLLAIGLFAATFCTEAVRSEFPVLEWRGFVGLVAVSSIWTFGLLVALTILSGLRGPSLPGRRAPANAGENGTVGVPKPR